MSVSYPLDLSGVAPTNLVNDELHSVNEAQFRDYYFIVPQFPPFYVDNFQLSLVSGSSVTLLNEDVDYSFALPYVTGTRHTGKQMYGAVTLHNLQMNGILKTRYQTVGGDQVADRLVVLSALADKAYNPRTTIWDTLTEVPNAFPPVPHYQDYDDFKGQDAVVQKLAEVRDAILANSSLTSEKISTFLNEFNQGQSNVYLKKTGDVMTGPLELRIPPSADLHAATKKYVDDNTTTSFALGQLLDQYATLSVMQANMNTKLSLTGGVMTGPIKLSADPVADEDATRKAYVDNVIHNQSLVIQSLQTTIANMQNVGTTKQYVDDRVNELLTRINAVGLQRS